MKQTDYINTNITCDQLTPIVHIDKPEPSAKDRVSISFYHTSEAQELLSPEAFFLYMYFALYNDKDTVQFSAYEFCDFYGWTHEKYMDAYNDLLSNEYLMTTTNETNILYFHDDPYVPIYLYDWDEADKADNDEV